MSTATLARHLHDWDSDAALYRLNPPLMVRGESHEFVIVSTQQPREGQDKDGTLVLAADPLGNVTDWTGLAHADVHTHDEALAQLGYGISA